ncbi:uncharacterized protein LOC115882871 isoform X2 [Sitophilus oryzae]|uniref:Uncharacterized protein LOC115882871 isoform X2 n=1 Tax=Sitophilus oryzae TaxID=7048 RepID=A0A6J2XZP4_SITOR|nr:uncharacterized protein LOC115882871 isoform X2 [Sitophilus oryzae]
MNKNGIKPVKYAVHWETHPQNFVKNVCGLMEHQSLVDVVICCGNNTIQTHKFILAANSPLFREEFEKNPSIEQILIRGCDFSVLKSVVEMMYCGQTVIMEENIKFLVAMVKMLEMKNLENLFKEHASCAEEVFLPKPQFLTKKPKYPAFTYQLPTTTVPQNGCLASVKVLTSEQNTSDIAVIDPEDATAAVVSTVQNGNAAFKPINFDVTLPDPVTAGFKQFRGKRTLKQQAEQACVKEAQASRLALASLQKEIAVAPQANNFIIEETYAETTVENFIPHHEQTYGDVMNYSNNMHNRSSMEKSMFIPGTLPQNNLSNLATYSSLIQGDKKSSFANEKLKMILGTDVPSNVEIMYKDARGNFVPVNEEVLQSLATKEGIQYQVVDEDGRVSELQELRVLDKLINNVPENLSSNEDIIDITKPSVEDGLCSLVTKSGNEISLSQPINIIPLSGEMHHKATIKTDVDFSPDIFFADLDTGNVQNEITIVGDNFTPQPETKMS